MKTMVINGGNDEKGTEKVLDFLTIHAEHQILKYAASKQQFCPVAKCGRILDYKKTVMIELKGGMIIIVCSKCYESEAVTAQLKKFKDQIKEVTKFRKA